MLDTIQSIKHDDDLPAIVRKKQRRKKPRNKFNTLHSIPVKTLNMRENSYHGSKNGKRMGFAVYTELACKQCKPDRLFHKREGLRLHSVIQHGREGSIFMRTSQSLPLKLSDAPTAVSNTRVTRANFNLLALNKSSSSNGRGREIIELEDKVDEDIPLLAYNDSENEALQVRTQPDDLEDVDYVDDDEDIVCVEIVEVGENHIKSFKPKNYRRMETSPLYQPEVLLLNSLNLKMREVSTSFDEVEMFMPPQIITGNVGQHEYYGDGDELIVLDDDNILLKSSRVKRRSVGGDFCNSASKRGRKEGDELLLVEDESDDNDDLEDIQNLLEVTMEEKDITEVDLEPEEVDLEPEEVDLESEEVDLESEEVDLESEEVDLKSEEVDLEPEEEDLEQEEVEVLHLDEQNNIDDFKLKPYKKSRLLL